MACKDLRVMIDSGNTLIQGIGINEKTHQLLGGLWHKRPKQKIIAGTSKQGAGLTILGLAAETTLKINGLQKTLICTPMVIRELSDNVNIGTAVLQKYGCSLVFSPSGTKLVPTGTKEEGVDLIKSIDGEVGNTVKMKPGELREMKPGELREMKPGELQEKRPGVPQVRNVKCGVLQDQEMKPGEL